MRALRALLLLAACAPAPAPAPSGPVSASFRADPAPDAAAPYAPVRLVVDATPCSLDPATFDARAVVLEPDPGVGIRLQLFPANCEVQLTVPEGLPVPGTFRVALSGRLRANGGRPVVAAPLTFQVNPGALRPPADPLFVASWPADGDDRVSAAAPVRAEFAAPLATWSAEANPPVPLSFTPLGSAALRIDPFEAWPPGDFTLTINATGERRADGTVVAESGTLHFRNPLPTDRVAPTFPGAGALSSTAAGTVLVTWEAARDDESPSPAIRYLVYVSDAATPMDWDEPAVVTSPGALSVELLPPAGGIRVAVRAQDEAGNVDDNVLVRGLP